MDHDLTSELDQNIVRLVTELNTFPGIITFSSCGGHAPPTTPSQCRAGTFEVNFNAYPLRGGWRSLELIASVVSESVEHDKLTITVWSMGGGTSICFELSGRGQADPELLAQNLASIRPMFDDDLTDSRED